MTSPLGIKFSWTFVFFVRERTVVHREKLSLAIKTGCHHERITVRAGNVEDKLISFWITRVSSFYMTNLWAVSGYDAILCAEIICSFEKWWLMESRLHCSKKINFLFFQQVPYSTAAIIYFCFQREFLETFLSKKTRAWLTTNMFSIVCTGSAAEVTFVPVVTSGQKYLFNIQCLPYVNIFLYIFHDFGRSVDKIWQFSDFIMTCFTSLLKRW